MLSNFAVRRCWRQQQFRGALPYVTRLAMSALGQTLKATSANVRLVPLAHVERLAILLVAIVQRKTRPPAREAQRSRRGC